MPESTFLDAASIARQEQELLQRGRETRFDRVREREFWSTYLFAPGMGGVIRKGSYDLFRTTKGGMGQGYNTTLTLRETNWPESGRVSNDFNIVIKSIHCDVKRAPTDTNCYSSTILPNTAGQAVTGKVDLYVPPHASDVIAVTNGMILGVTTLTNTVPYGYLADFPAVGGVVGWNQGSRQIAAAANATPGYATTVNAAGNRANLPITRNATNPAFERRSKVPIFLAAGQAFSMTLIVPDDITMLDINATTAATGESNDASGCLEVRVSFWGVESYVRPS